ncbi:hypothetical protein B0H14DRAFT_2571424 [Mycena olivaceomarginata]|nr:hypothetical protein B0H14DRAFT_2571424 [Mycena olivaceomarginata]
MELTNPSPPNGSAHGLILEHTWASHYVNLEGATAEHIGVIIPRLEALLRLIPATLKVHSETTKQKPVASSDEEYPVAASSAKPADRFRAFDCGSAGTVAVLCYKQPVGSP